MSFYCLFSFAKNKYQIQQKSDVSQAAMYIFLERYILEDCIQLFFRRTAVRADTCCIAAISLNIQERVHPVIWSMNNLPFDCCKVMAVPKPIGKIIIKKNDMNNFFSYSSHDL